MACVDSGQGFTVVCPSRGRGQGDILRPESSEKLLPCEIQVAVRGRLGGIEAIVPKKDISAKARIWREGKNLE